MPRIAAADALERSLEKSQPPAVWISGEEPLLVIEAADTVRAAARRHGFVERTVVEVGARFDTSLLVEATRSRSLFGGRTLVDIRLAGKPTKDLGEALSTALSPADPDTALLITTDRLERATVSTAWFTALEPRLLWLETPRVDRDALPRWLAGRLQRQGQRADARVLALIADRTEGNLLAAHQAIARMGLLLPPGDLSLDAVAELVIDSARYAVFDLFDVALSGDVARAVRTVEGLRSEDAALPLVSWALADGIRRLLKVRALMDGGQPLPAALRGAGIFGRREALARQAMTRIGGDLLARLLREAARLDRMAKGVAADDAAGQDPWAAVEALVVGIAGGRRLSA